MYPNFIKDYNSIKYKMNKKNFKYLFLLVIWAFTGLTYSQVPGNGPVMQTRVYKTKGLKKLKLHLYQPTERNDIEKLPAIIFFHGGGLRERHTWEFEPQSKYLIERGMVAVLATYTIERHGRTQFESIADAKSAIRWVREHADELGIDKNRIAAGGGSAGGYLAACTGLINNLDEPDEDLSISSIPNALVLFNPRLALPEIGDPPLSKKDIRYLNGRAVEEVSPFHNIHKGAPPTIVFQGTADKSASPGRFCEEMKNYGNACEVVLYEGREHGFFHYYLNEGNNPDFYSTMEETVKFLTAIGYINGETTIKK
jgi:acetyl esterase/lipase